MRSAIYGVLFMLTVLDAAPCQLPNEPLLIGLIRRELPKGWECTLVREAGLKGHPHGLSEPMFRVTCHNPRVSFDGKGKAQSPVIPLFFYSIVDKSQVMNVVERERLYSWDIPQYFGETEEYVVITSSALVNDGTFTDEARKAIRPMWHVLRRHIVDREGRGIDALARP